MSGVARHAWYLTSRVTTTLAEAVFCHIHVFVAPRCVSGDAVYVAVSATALPLLYTGPQTYTTNGNIIIKTEIFAAPAVEARVVVFEAERVCTAI